MSDRLRPGFGGAVMEGEFTDFPNSTCTIAESIYADNGPCRNEAEAEALFGRDSDGDVIGVDTIDRTGTQTPRTPDWKFVAQVDNWMLMFDRYKASLNSKANYSES